MDGPLTTEGEIPCAVSASALTKCYPGAAKAAVDGLDLAVPRGSFFGLLGPNGAGKTTLVSMLTCVMRPTSGELSVAGFKAHGESLEIKRRIGFVPQEAALYPTLTGRENLLYFGGMQGLSGTRLRERVAWCLDLANLHGHADLRVETYSGGLRRRLAIVVGLIHDPEVLFLDEPTVGIDPQSRLFIYERLRALNDDGMTIVYTSHYMEEVEQLCDEIAIIDHGRIIARGRLEELLTGQGRRVIEARTGRPVSPSLESRLRNLPGVEELFVDEKRITLRCGDPLRDLGGVIGLLESEGAGLLSVSYGVTNLEQLFIALTGARLRE